MWILICTILAGAVSSLVLFGVYYRKTSGICTCKNRLQGKTLIITGATAGIGKEAALDFASRGARIIIGARNMEKAEKARDWIISSTGNENVIARHLELSDMDSVRKFAEETLKTENRIDVLINNAGIMTFNKQLSKQGHELTLATNHYGSFLLTNLLLGLIKKSSSSRIVNVSSDLHAKDNLDLDDIYFQKRSYSGIPAYSQSKLCNVLFTKELARRLGSQGKTDVTVNVLHPGAVAIDIVRNETSFAAYVISFMMVGFKDIKQGAQTIIHLAVSDKVKNITGEFFVDCKVAKSSNMSHDPDLARRLWELSEKEAINNRRKAHLILRYINLTEFLTPPSLISSNQSNIYI